MASRFTEVLVEILRRGSPKVRHTETLVEVLRRGSPKVRHNEVLVEVLYKRHIARPRAYTYLIS